MLKYRILILEDEEQLSNTFKKELEREGYYVDQASDGAIGLQLWQERVYDLILLDLRLPEIDGIELMKTFRSQQKLTQIIIISGASVEEDLKRAINNNIYAYIDKPVDLDELLEIIKKAINDRDPILLALESMARIIPDKPVLLIGKQKISPKQMYDEVRKGTAFGKQYISKKKKSYVLEYNSSINIDSAMGMEGII